MDTITQALLGGAVGYAVAGKTAGKKALLWGAAIGILPDLDVFIPYDSDLDNMTYHRSWTHSWLVQTAVAPIMAALLHRFDKAFSLARWWWLVWLVLVTHSGLDALTVYGTQLFWPFMPSPVSGGSVFIIDPAYSIPLLLGFLFILLKPDRKLSDRVMRFGFIFSCVYLTWGFTAQQWMESEARQQLAEQHIDYTQIQVTATAMNTLLWRVLVINDEYYYEGFRSVFDSGKPLVLSRHDRGKPLIKQVQTLPAYQRINWFTNGLMKLEQRGSQIIASDLRMGMEPVYFFRFKLAEKNSEQIKATVPNRVNSQFRREDGIRWVWQRIWNPAVQLEFSPQLTD